MHLIFLFYFNALAQYNLINFNQFHFSQVLSFKNFSTFLFGLASQTNFISHAFIACCWHDSTNHHTVSLCHIQFTVCCCHWTRLCLAVNLMISFHMNCTHFYFSQNHTDTLCCVYARYDMQRSVSRLMHWIYCDDVTNIVLCVYSI